MFFDSEAADGPQVPEDEAGARADVLGKGSESGDDRALATD